MSSASAPAAGSRQHCDGSGQSYRTARDVGVLYVVRLHAGAEAAAGGDYRKRNRVVSWRDGVYMHVHCACMRLWSVQMGIYVDCCADAPETLPAVYMARSSFSFRAAQHWNNSKLRLIPELKGFFTAVAMKIIAYL